MEQWISLAVVSVTLLSALVNLQTAKINRRLAKEKAEAEAKLNAEKEKAANPVTAGKDGN